jgi:hypothetical protein
VLGPVCTTDRLDQGKRVGRVGRVDLVGDSDHSLER